MAVLKKMLLFFQKNPLVTLILFFLLSVAVRLPNLNRPLSKHHELNAALVLINAEEWNRKSPSHYDYVPVHSYHQPGDDVYNENNILVNVSFGSLWYVMPYGFFKLLQSEPSPLLLQIFNLLLHLITVLLIYQLAQYLFKNETDAKAKALLTSILYLFSPSPLWFHGNGYVHEIAVLPFIYSALLLYLYVQKQHSSILKYFLLSVVIAAGICSDWFMCFVAAALFICSLFNYLKTRLKRDLLLLCFITTGVVGGILITVWQFSSFMGLQTYLNALLSRFVLRGIKGAAEGGGLSKGTGLASFYLLAYGLLIPFIFFSYFLIKRYKVSLVENIKLKQFIIIGSIVCLSHHLLFWGFSNIHDYSVVKSGFIISLLSTIAIYAIKERTKRIGTLLLLMLMNIGIYYYINLPGKYAANGQPYSYFKDLGENIKPLAKPEEYIFIDIPEMSLLLTYYCKRSYRNVKDINEALHLFKNLPGRQALFIHTNNFEFVSYTRLTK